MKIQDGQKIKVNLYDTKDAEFTISATGKDRCTYGCGRKGTRLVFFHDGNQEILEARCGYHTPRSDPQWIITGKEPIRN